MSRLFGIVVVVVALFIGFLLGYSIPPFIQSGVFTDREQKGVAVEIDEDMEKYYENLYEKSE